MAEIEHPSPVPSSPQHHHKRSITLRPLTSFVGSPSYFLPLRLNCRQPLARSSGSLDIKTPRQRRTRQRTGTKEHSRLLLVKLNRGFPRSLLEPHFNRCVGSSLFEFLPTAPHLFSAFPQPLSLSHQLSLCRALAICSPNQQLPPSFCILHRVVGCWFFAAPFALFVNSITTSNPDFQSLQKTAQPKLANLPAWTAENPPPESPSSSVPER